MKVKGDRDRRKKGRGRAKKVKREREIPCNRTDRTERELPSCVCVRWLVGTRGWKHNRSLIYCIIRSRFTRAHLHPTLISLSPAPYFPFYPSSSRETTATRITISGERVETGRERAERKGGRDIEGWQEGTCAGFVRQRGSWFEWSYATWLEILSNLRLHITWQQRCARLQIEPASVAGRSRESEDDYKRWYERFHERCNYVFVGILRVYISSTCDFSNCDPRRSPLSQTRIRLFFFRSPRKLSE